MFGWQIVVNTKERTVLFADEAALRRGVHAIGRSIGAQAALFCLVDDHLHAIVAGADHGSAYRHDRARRVLDQPHHPADPGLPG